MIQGLISQTLTHTHTHKQKWLPAQQSLTLQQLTRGVIFVYREDADTGGARARICTHPLTRPNVVRTATWARSNRRHRLHVLHRPA